MRIKEIIKITGLPVLFASLCCLAPLVLVLLGLSTVAFGASLADNWYGNYKWAFRSMGFLALIVSLIIYFRGKGICTIDHVKRQRRKVVNTVLIAILFFVVGYIVFLYGIVEIVGIWAGVWENPFPKWLAKIGIG